MAQEIIQRHEPDVDLSVGLPSANELGRLVKMADAIARTNFVPQSFRGKPEEVLACILTGRELGIGPMQALRHIPIVNGRATLDAELMVALIRKRGHSIEGTSDTSKATVKGRRADNGDTMTVTWTIEMAKRAKLAGKDNWTAYPEAMLWARAVSQLARQLFADILSGVSYTPTEAEEIPDVPPEHLDEAPADEPVVTVEEPVAPGIEPPTPEQRVRLTHLHNTLPDGAKWGRAKMTAEVGARGYEATMGELVREHVSSCGPGCAHIKDNPIVHENSAQQGEAEPAAEPAEDYLPGVEEG